MINPVNAYQTKVNPTPRQSYNAGFNAYCDMRPLSDMTDENMRRGWLAANKAEAEASVDGYAAMRRN